MFEFVKQDQFWIAVVAYWVFSAAVSALPEPASNSKLDVLPTTDRPVIRDSPVIMSSTMPSAK